VEVSPDVLEVKLLERTFIRGDCVGTGELDAGKKADDSGSEGFHVGLLKSLAETVPDPKPGEIIDHKPLSESKISNQLGPSDQYSKAVRSVSISDTRFAVALNIKA